MNGKCTWLSIEVYRWNVIAKAMVQSIEGTSESNFGKCIKRSCVSSGSLGGSSYENLELELVKPFNPSRREIRVPEYRREIKDPNTTQWRRGPVSRTAMLVKVLQCLDSTSAKECGRGIPTGSQL